MSTDSRPVRPVTVSIPGQRRSVEDVLGSAGDPQRPTPLPRSPSRWAAAAGGLLALGGAVLLGSPPWAAPPAVPAAPAGPGPVTLALVQPVPAATARPHGDGSDVVTLRLRVAVRNDSPAWVSLTDASLGPYRAVGDGLGRLAPGALTSVPLERRVVCDDPAPEPAPRFLELDVLGARGPAEVYLALTAPGATDPVTALPACTQAT